MSCSSKQQEGLVRVEVEGKADRVWKKKDAKVQEFSVYRAHLVRKLAKVHQFIPMIS
ncbi:hypothetical protein D3C73_1436020 [compost metagenome]